MTNTRQITTWYEKAQIDYVHHYMALYASFNAWYSSLNKGMKDRQAINSLRVGMPLWDEYCRGELMRPMVPYMQQLVECTQREPLSYASPHWRGVVQHRHDWVSLLEYWYRVRCLVMHGAQIRGVYVYLAYQTLNIYMGEVIKRQRH